MESTELQSACVSLGFRERDGYALEPDCLATVKLLIRFLRNELDGHSVRWQLGYARIVQNDLIPMLQYHSQNRELSDAVLRLLLNLSQPTLVCFNGRVPTDKPTRKTFIELDQFLCSYKQAFANVDFLKVVTASMAKLVKSEHEGKLREEDRLILERYLLLIRNVLHIDDAKFHASGLAGEDLSGPGVHDELLLAISRSGLDRLLLYLATSAEEHGFALHVLEILWLLFKDISPALLIAASKNDGSAAIKLSADDINELRQPLGTNSANRRSSYRAELRGTFSVQNKWLSQAGKVSNTPEQEKPNSTSSMVIHRHTGADDANSALGVIGNNKKRAKKSCQRDIAMEDTLEKDRCDVIATIRPAVRDFLGNFARRLLVDASGYNNLMAAADRIITTSPTDSHDESFYLWAVSFFMELARGLLPIAKAVECVGQTLGLEALTFVHTHMSTYADGLDTDRFDKQMWNKRLVLAVRAFGEQIAWADALARCTDDPGTAELGRNLVLNIVYEPQFRDILPQLLKRYKESRHCRAYLRYLISAVHAHLRLMDHLNESCDNVIVAAPKRKSGSSKSKTKRKPKKLANIEPVEKQPWTEKESSVREAISSEDLDALSDHPVVRGVIEPMFSDNGQVIEATLTRIEQLLLKEEPRHAVAAIRLVRKLYPEHAERFGGCDPTSTEEETFIAALYDSAIPVLDDNAHDNSNDDNAGNEEDSSDDEEGMGKKSKGEKETHLNVAELASKFCNVLALQPYVALLETWATNPVEANHHLARFFKRVAVDWALPTMLYQARIFQVCQKILAAQENSQNKVVNGVSELASFAKFAVSGFFKLSTTVGKVSFAEILFWKNRLDALAFASNYETLVEVEETKKKKVAVQEAEVPPETSKMELIKLGNVVRKADEGSSEDADEEAILNMVKASSTGENEMPSTKKTKKTKRAKKDKSQKSGGKAESDVEVVNEEPAVRAKKRTRKNSGESIPKVKKAKAASSTQQSRMAAFAKSSDSDSEPLVAKIQRPESAQQSPRAPSEASSSAASLEIDDDDEPLVIPAVTENDSLPNFDEGVLLSARNLSSDEEEDKPNEQPIQRKKTRRLVSSDEGED